MSAQPMRAVTVVVPTMRTRRSLFDTIATLLAQVDAGGALLHPSILIVDDAEHGTSNLIDLPDAPGLSVVRTAGRTGEGNARNAGLERVETEWVAFCDDDDLWTPTKLSGQFAVLAGSTARWCASEAMLVDPCLAVLGISRLDVDLDLLDPAALRSRMLGSNRIVAGASNVLAETDFVRSAGGYATDLAIGADWETWVRFAERSPIAVARDLAVAYVQHPDQVTGPMHGAWDALALVRERHGAYADGGQRTGDGVALWIAQRRAKTIGWRAAIAEYRSHEFASLRPRERLAVPARAAMAIATQRRRRPAGQDLEAAQRSIAAIEAVLAGS